MRNFPFYRLLLYVCLFAAASCGKQKVTSSAEDPIRIAKERFEAGVQQTPRTGNGSLPGSIESLDWPLAFTRTLAPGTPVVIVPARLDGQFKTREGGQEHALNKQVYLFLYTTKSGAFATEIVTYLPERLAAAADKHQGRFNGIVLVDNWSGGIQKAYRYTAQSRQTLRESKPTQSNMRTSGSCVSVDWYQCVYIGDYQDCRFLYTKSYCTEDQGDSGPDGGDGGGGGGGIDYGDTGGGGSGGGASPATSGDVSIYEIKDSLQDTCLKKMLKAALDTGLKNWIARTLDTIAGIKGDYDFVFREKPVSFFGDSSIMGQFNTQDTHFGGPPTNPKQYGSIVIDLNVSLLPQMSQEAIATVIYHEAIHGLLAARGIIVDVQHETMAQSYQKRIADGLTELFPGLPPNDASALGWIGLTKTYEFYAIKIYDINNATGIAKSILQTALDYQKNIKGTASGCQ